MEIATSIAEQLERSADSGVPDIGLRLGTERGPEVPEGSGHQQIPEERAA